MNCNKCNFYSNRSNQESEVKFCNDKEEFTNGLNGDLCCRYHPDAVLKIEGVNMENFETVMNEFYRKESYEKIRKIINNTLYFDDSSDYGTALWQALEIIEPEWFKDDLEPILEYIEK